MTAQDFTSYSEVDTNGRLSQTITRATWADMIRGETAILYKALTCGADGIEYHFTFKLSAIDSNASTTYRYLAVLMEFCETYGDPHDGNEVGKGIILSILESSNSTTVYTLYLSHIDGSVYDYSSNLSVGTIYYVKLTRSGNVFTVAIYSDKAESTVVDTITIDMAGESDLKTNYAILQTTAALNGAGDTTDQSDGYIENFHLTRASWLVSLIEVDPKITVTSLLNTNVNAGTYDITKDNGSTNTTFLAEFDLAEETIKELLASSDVVVSVSQGEGVKDQIGLQTWEERLPINIDIYVIDKYSAGSRIITGTKVRWKAKDELIKLLKASTITAGGNIQILEVVEDEDSDITTERPYLYHSAIKTEAVFVRHG